MKQHTSCPALFAVFMSYVCDRDDAFTALHAFEGFFIHLCSRIYDGRSKREYGREVKEA